MPHPTFSLRTATPSDAPGVAAIYNQAVADTTATLDLVARTEAEQRLWIAQRSGAYCVVVATAPISAPAGGQPEAVVGFASLSPYKPRAAYNTTVEDSVYVAPDWVGRGVGRSLLGEVIQRARTAGFHTVIARIESGSTASLGLHEALGFSTVGTEREVGRKFGRWLDMTVMQLMLRDVDIAHQRDADRSRERP